MRASLYLIGFAAASIAGAGVTAIGCSSSSSPAASNPEDAAVTDAPTAPEDTGTTPGDAGTTTPCTPKYDASAATLVAPDVPGEASWTCLEGHCGPSLNACAADCTCNNDILGALYCLAPPDGGSLTACFGPVLSSSNMADMTVLGCLQTNMSKCLGDGGATAEGGTSDAGATDAGTADAGDGG